MEAGSHPAEPIICLDDLQSEQAMLHPLEAAVDTVVEAFVKSEPVLYLSRPGHEREYMRALLRLSRAERQYEVHEAGDFGAVALVHEVPPAPAAAPSESGSEKDVGEGGAAGVAGAAGMAGRRPPPRASRAEASANVEPGAQLGEGAPAGGGGGPNLEYDPVELRAAAAEGSLDALLALGVPRLQAELLRHARPDRLREVQQVQQGLDAVMQEYAQAHGPLLRLHFLATRPAERGRGRGRQLLHHLERMADAEGRRLYLEATSPDNRRLYLRHGFRDVGQHRVGDEQEGLTFHLMVRPPGARSLPASTADLQAAGSEVAGAAGGKASAASVAAQGKGAAGPAVWGEGTLLRDEL